MNSHQGEKPIYEFRVEGRLDSNWSEWFEGLTFRYEMNEETGLQVTILSGPVIDQSALHGILRKIGNLNIKLLSVNEVRTKHI